MFWVQCTVHIWDPPVKNNQNVQLGVTKECWVAKLALWNAKFSWNCTTSNKDDRSNILKVYRIALHKAWSELNVYFYYVTHNSKSIHLIMTTLYCLYWRSITNFILLCNASINPPSSWHYLLQKRQSWFRTFFMIMVVKVGC